MQRPFRKSRQMGTSAGFVSDHGGPFWAFVYGRWLQLECHQLVPPQKTPGNPPDGGGFQVALVCRTIAGSWQLNKQYICSQPLFVESERPQKKKKPGCPCQSTGWRARVRRQGRCRRGTQCSEGTLWEVWADGWSKKGARQKGETWTVTLLFHTVLSDKPQGKENIDLKLQFPFGQ